MQFFFDRRIEDTYASYLLHLNNFVDVTCDHVELCSESVIGGIWKCKDIAK